MKDFHQFCVAVFFFLLCGLMCTSCLRLTKIRIPNHTIVNNSAQLACNYELDGEPLYSVKWYKGVSEFYRFVPNDMPQVHVFSLPGINIDIENSSDSIVVLKSTNLLTAGSFTCEVSTDAPSFKTVSGSGDMIVVVLPQDGPKIFGGRLTYKIGDTVNVNCSSGRSKPAAKLSWMLNGKPADANYLKYYNNSTSDADSLETTVLGLNFLVTANSFVNGEMKLKCLATILTVYSKSNEENVGYDESFPVAETEGQRKERVLRITGHGSIIRIDLLVELMALITVFAMRQNFAK